MPDSVTVTSSQSWLSRIGKAIVGVFIGLVMCAVAFPLLWWNEGRAVHRARSLAEGASIVVDVPVDNVSPANEGKLIHATGLATTDRTLTDPEFGISSAGAIQLARIAETYQWHEESSTKKRKKLGGGEETTKTYTYSKKWSSTRIDSSSFNSPGGHENPALRWESQTQTATPVTFGAFTLPPQLVEKIGGRQQRPTGEGDEAKMQTLGFRPGPGDYFYLARNPSDPQVGDVRVRFDVLLPRTVSIVAQQRGSSFEGYQARAGSEILLLDDGTVAAEQMFKAARTANTITTWAIRLGGFLVMFIGLALILRPISVLGSVVPLIGTVLGAGTGLLSFLIAAVLSLLTMALAWLAYRPLLSGGLLLVAAGAVFLIVRSRKPKRVVPPPIPVGR